MTLGESEPVTAESHQSPTHNRTRTRARTSRSLRSLASSKATLAIFDQAIVSGTRFVASVVIGRLCGKQELGVYSLTFAIFLIFSCTQEALVTTPYTVFGNRLSGRRRQGLAGSVFMHSLILSISAALLLAVVGAVLWTRSESAELAPAMLALAVILPWMLFWEFARRYNIAHLQLDKALTLDAVTAAVQIVAIAGLAWHGQLSAATGYLALGVGCACTATVWFLLARSEFRFGPAKAVYHWRKNWNFGRWVLASQIIGTLNGYTPAWVLAFALGTSATGVFAACQNLVLLSNPLILAITSLVAATSAHAFAEGGYTKVREIIRYWSLYSSAAMGVLWLILVVAGGPAVVALYGTEFSGNGHVVSMIALAAPVWALSSVVGVGLRAVERPDSDFHGRFIGLAVTVVLSIPLVVLGGILGVAGALVAGSTASAVWQAWAFHRMASQASSNRLSSQRTN